MTTDASTDYAPRRRAQSDWDNRSGADGDDRPVAQKPSREAMVHIHRDRISEVIKGLFEQVGVLEDRLGPVLIQEPEDTRSMASVGDPAPPQSSVAGYLDGFANDLGLIRHQLQALQRRLDI